MLDIGLATGCDVLLLPERGGDRSVAVLCADVALLDAVRYVVEELANERRERAVIRTPKRNVFAEEAATFYAMLGQQQGAMPRAARRNAGGMPFAA